MYILKTFGMIVLFAAIIAAVTVGVIRLTVLTGLVESNPAYLPCLTTWAGKPAYGQLHRDGWYTFYGVIPSWTSPRGFIPGSRIASFPAGEAAKLH